MSKKKAASKKAKASPKKKTLKKSAKTKKPRKALAKKKAATRSRAKVKTRAAARTRKARPKATRSAKKTIKKAVKKVAPAKKKTTTTARRKVASRPAKTAAAKPKVPRRTKQTLPPKPVAAFTPASEYTPPPMPAAPIAEAPPPVRPPAPERPAIPSPQVGDIAPDFALPDESGTIHTLGQYRGQRVVLYFYPRDNTPGCTTEACGFRDTLGEFTDRRAVVLGVSPDSIESHRGFASRYSLPFALLADADHVVAERYGVWVEKVRYGERSMGIDRTTFIIDEAGRIAHVFRNVQPTGHEREVLDRLATMPD